MKTNKIIITVISCFLLILNGKAQDKYFTKTGDINFFSKAPLENITADNKDVLSIINVETGEMAIQMKMIDFTFEKALMQEHFNENYIESDKYPTATFKGTITDFKNMSDTKKEHTVKGVLTIHGVSKNVEIKANFKKANNAIDVDGNFIVALKDYKIKIPKIVFMNIAENIKVTFKFNHQPYTK
ncbi:YceI family protein [Polaribacter marinivivus]|uniref:YceI family protein n=1 Tax=Polaribacter marinivivus TaxID=1524260 RepID=A0ABV8R936_9FLAO